MEKNSRRRHRQKLSEKKLKDVTSYLILFMSFLIFYLTANGFIEEITQFYKPFLLNNIGLTNKWSSSYGPQWFVYINSDISTFGGPIFLIFLLVFITGYFYFTKNIMKLLLFYLIVIGGGFFDLILKVSFSGTSSHSFFGLILNSKLGYPSGHAMMSTIIFSTLVYLSTLNSHNHYLKQFLTFCAVVFVFIIGMSRIFIGAHDPNQVIAGWSAGIFWITLCWLILSKSNFIKEKIFSKQNN